MPIRQSPSRRANAKIIEELKAAIHNGVPWEQPQTHVVGYADLIYLVTGLFYAVTNFIRSSDDLDAAKEIWWHIREDIIAEHIARSPGSRPWAWWALEDREPRRRLTERCVCRPATDNHKFPPRNLSCFGRPRGCRCDYEDEADYLGRLGLLDKEERRALQEREGERRISK
jgi:hypothetical protein